MINPFHVTRDAHALRVLFRRYLRSRGYNPCSREMFEAFPDCRHAVTPLRPLTFCLFLEWLSECPEVQKRVETVERELPAALEFIELPRDERRRLRPDLVRIGVI